MIIDVRFCNLKTSFGTPKAMLYYCTLNNADFCDILFPNGAWISFPISSLCDEQQFLDHIIKYPDAPEPNISHVIECKERIKNTLNDSKSWKNIKINVEKWKWTDLE